MKDILTVSNSCHLLTPRRNSIREYNELRPSMTAPTGTVQQSPSADKRYSPRSNVVRKVARQAMR